MNVLASKAPIGSAGISILPFGKGAERMLNNKEIGCSIRGLDFNAHGKHHIRLNHIQFVKRSKMEIPS